MRALNVVNPTCTFCSKELETRNHIFYNCIHVQEFWSNFRHYVKKLTNNPLFPTLQQVIIGSLECSNLLNHLLIIGKQYIYQCKMNDCLPAFPTFQIMVKQIEKIEKYIAKNNNKLGLHTKKWSDLENM